MASFFAVFSYNCESIFGCESHILRRSEWAPQPNAMGISTISAPAELRK